MVALRAILQGVRGEARWGVCGREERSMTCSVLRSDGADLPGAAALGVPAMTQDFVLH